MSALSMIEWIPDASRLSFNTSRWATFREENVSSVASRWVESPFLVQVLDDPRLGSAHLVVLRKDLFDRMLGLVRAFEAARTPILIELQQAARVSTVLVEMASGKEQLLAQTVLTSCQRIQAQLVPVAPSDLGPPPVPAEHREWTERQARLDAMPD